MMDESSLGLFNKVATGEALSIPAALWNAMIDAALANRYGEKQKPQLTTQGRPTSIIRIRNDTEGTIQRFALLALDTALVTPAENLAEFQRAIMLSGVTPEAGTHEGLYAVLQEPLAPGVIGSAIVSGATVAQIAGPEDMAFAEIEDDSYVLLAGDSGSARILYDPGIADGETEDDPRWAYVRIGEGGASGSGNTVLVAVSGQISTTFFGTGKLVSFPTGGGSPSLGADIYVQQFLHYPGPESSWLLGNADNPFLGTYIGVGDPAEQGEDLPVYVVIPRVASTGITVIGKASGAGNDVTYEDVDTLTFSLPEIVSGGNGSVDIGLQNLNLTVECANGNITGNAAWED